MSNECAIYTMSCDNTADIAKYFLTAFQQNWPNCSYPCFIGTNSQEKHLEKTKFFPLKSPKSSWKEETLFQINSLQNFSPKTKYLLVFLDDFILNKKVINDNIKHYIDLCIQHNLQYLRLTPMEQSWTSRIINNLKKSNINREISDIFQITQSHPYYSSLQVAVWNIDHLQESIRQSQDIWNFETQRKVNIQHYSVDKRVLHYQHIVEKGLWSPFARELCETHLGFFEPGERESLEIHQAQLQDHFRRLRFNLFGYSLMRGKQWLKKLL